MKLKARLVTGVLFITLVACGLLVLNGNLRVAVEFTADPAAGQGAGRAAQGAETSREEVLHEKKPWRLLQFGITRYSLYARNDPNVEEVLKAIRTQEVTYVEMKPGGTQLKLFMEFEDTSIGLFKPWRWPRDRETPPDHFYFTDYERHNAEIAAYHLDRILDFRRCPPVSGRWFNVTSEIRQKSEDEKLLKTFFVSPIGNVCFFGDCSYYCNTEHMICAIKDHHMLEGSVAAYLPRWQEAPRKTWKHPWKRSYSRVRKADWEVTDGETFCRQVRSTPPYDKGRRFGDLLDLTVYDFLMGNMDRHHYETFKAFGNNSAPIHLDQGRAIRKSTWLRLQLLAKEDYRLSDVMRESMRTDPIAPILTEPHLLALDRRVGIILDTVAKCIQKKGAENVLLEDLKDTTIANRLSIRRSFLCLAEEGPGCVKDPAPGTPSLRFSLVATCPGKSPRLSTDSDNKLL
uniref:FAM20 C-terminal domain-containing protein n=1 Tax=Branchiostoma floridae TaxID=7739 RepID=C3YC87_BRAFL|eukprot:XP_002606109.1 hypothetical protein BRAFLDRAFT_88019 [Branchiostoma floridae]